MKNPPEIIIVGSHAPGILVHTRRIPVAGETVIGWGFREPMDGGKGSNQAIAAARLGGKAAFVGCVGKDRIGGDARRWMEEAGVNTDCLFESDRFSSGIGFIILNEVGVPAMVTSMGANEELNRDLVIRAFDDLGAARVMLTQFEIPAEVALFAAGEARRRGMLSIVNPAPASRIPLADLSAAQVLVPNETEAKALLGMDPEAAYEARSIAEELHQKSKCETVIVTLGGEGIVGVDAAGLWQITPTVVDVVDTSGAGDAFCAALAVGYVRGMGIRSASAWAVQVAALSVTREGTIPAFPTDQEVEEFMQRTPAIRDR